jgi:hypothetical protein
MNADTVVGISLDNMLKLRICKAIFREEMDGPGVTQISLFEWVENSRYHEYRPTLDNGSASKLKRVCRNKLNVFQTRVDLFNCNIQLC